MMPGRSDLRYRTLQPAFDSLPAAAGGREHFPCNARGNSHLGGRAGNATAPPALCWQCAESLAMQLRAAARHSVRHSRPLPIAPGAFLHHAALPATGAHALIAPGDGCAMVAPGFDKGPAGQATGSAMQDIAAAARGETGRPGRRPLPGSAHRMPTAAQVHHTADPRVPGAGRHAPHRSSVSRCVTGGNHRPDWKEQRS